MEAKEFIKALIVLLVFPVGGPLLGAVIRGRPRWQDAVFAIMCAMTINGLLGPGNWGLTLDSVETYRGHTKGYHFYFNHALGIALMVAAFLEKPFSKKVLPPGIFLYLFYWLVSSFSITSAIEPELHLMAMHKMLFILCIFFGAYSYLKDRKRILFFFRVMAGVLVWEAIVVLKSKYIDGQYQAKGTFEHQNALAMYANLIAMPLLALSLGPNHPRNKWLFAGFLACSIVVVAALSRASLLIFAAGVAMMIAFSQLQKPSAHRYALIAVLAVCGIFGGLVSLDTIISRFHDRGNIASEEYREVLNEAAVAMVRDYPTGVGWNNYATVINDPYPYAEFVWEWLRERGHRVDLSRVNSTVESHYFLLIAENGWLGLVTYLLLITVALVRNLRAIIDCSDVYWRLISIGIAMGCFLNYTQSHFERVLTQPRNLMLWMILFAITARIETIRRNGKKSLKSISTPQTPGQPKLLKAQTTIQIASPGRSAPRAPVPVDTRPLIV